LSDFRPYWWSAITFSWSGFSGRQSANAYSASWSSTVRARIISGRTALARNLLRPVSLLAGYLVGGLLVAVTGRHQHLGDRLAGTVVVARDRSTDSSVESDDSAATDDNTSAESTGSNQPPAASDPS
jgi:hypothetical protein